MDRDEIDLEYVEVPKLKLSDADDEFFQNIIGEKTAVSKRASHERIQAARDRLVGFMENDLLKSGSPWEKAKRVQLLVNSVLATDCSVIFMCSETRGEAYQIFQVLNDRGVHLIDGDLLRASTLELSDSTGLSSIQNKLSERWDSVLAYRPGRSALDAVGRVRQRCWKFDWVTGRFARKTGGWRSKKVQRNQKVSW